MTSEYDPSGKFQRVSSGDMALPAQCASCGTVDNPSGFVDTKIDAEFYGVIYFCCDCAFELTTVFPEAPYHTMRNRILGLENDVIAKDARIASLERSLDGFTAARLSDRGVNIVGGIISGADVPPEPITDADVNDDSEPEGTDDSEPAEPVTEPVAKRPANAKRSDDLIALD
jgi:hypothetical protein